MEKSAIYRAAQMDLRERERCAEIVAAQQFEKAEKCTREKVDSIAQVDHQTLDSPVNDSAETDLHSNVCTSKLDQVTKVSDSIDEDRENLEAIEDD
ncbi:hypothetical protein R6Q59_024947 [Mikania micrantha]